MFLSDVLGVEVLVLLSDVLGVEVLVFLSDVLSVEVLVILSDVLGVEVVLLVPITSGDDGSGPHFFNPFLKRPVFYSSVVAKHDV